ncbi:MAG: M3 family oligoendopeptidase [bacterium]
MRIKTILLFCLLITSISIGATMETYKNDFKCFANYPKTARAKILQIKITDDLPVWDLSYIYSGYSDPKIMEDLNKSIKASADFKKKYEANINKEKLSAMQLLAAIKEYEVVWQTAILPQQYVSNVHNTDMNNSELMALLGKIEIMTSSITKNTSFFENGLARTSDKYKKKIFTDKKLSDYSNWLSKVATKKTHLLPEDQEQILIDKDINGVNAWANFRSIYESKYSFMFRGPDDNEEKKYTLTQLTKFVEDSNRDVRQKAARLFLNKFNQDSYIYAQIYNSIIQDMILIEKNRRGYTPMISVRNVGSQLDDKVVDVMHQVIKENYKLAQRYWKIKAQLLKIKDFNNADVRAPFVVKDDRKYTYTQALDLLQDTYNSFYKPFGSAFENMYRCGLVHATLKAGKRGGAYCDYFGPTLAPIILVNYQGTLDDVSTIAHEGGHWVHGLLFSEKQTLLNSDIPMATAETASVFNEMLLTSRLLKENKDNKETSLSILISKLDGIMGTVFRQAAFSYFEQAAFKASENGPLTPEQFSDVFVKEYGDLFGDAVKMTPDFKYEWARIPHFMRPFYVYAYAFGELATLSLYQKYMDNPKEFPAEYMEFLEAGSSLNPQDLFAKVNIDLKQRETWQSGFRYISSLIDQTEKLVSDMNR